MGRHNQEIDLGLAVSGALLPPGKSRSLSEIAAFCGCSRQYLEQIENKALLKIRNKVLFSPQTRETLASFLIPPAPSLNVRDNLRKTHHPAI